MDGFNRVLIGPLPLREYETEDGQKGAVRDGSFIPYIAEELISRSAFQVVLEATSQSHVESIAPALKDRVCFVDSKESFDKSESYLAPLFEEACLSKEGCVYVYGPEEVDDSYRQSVASIDSQLQTYLLAIEEGLQIDIDLEYFLNTLKRVRTLSKGTESRARIAVLEGIVSSYKSFQAPGLVAVPAAQPQIVEYFRRLVIDSDYCELSKSAQGLGVVGRSKQGLEAMRRGTSALLGNKYFKKGFNQGAKAISLATQVHVPDTEVADSLLSRGFLPPIISLNEAMSSAVDQWQLHNPKLIHIDPEMNKQDLKTGRVLIHEWRK